jgi:hypothetical protein
MNCVNVPLMIPKKLRAELKTAARETGLKQADLMRHSIAYGLPKIREAFQKLKTDALATGK